MRNSSFSLLCLIIFLLTAVDNIIGRATKVFKNRRFGASVVTRRLISLVVASLFVKSSLIFELELPKDIDKKLTQFKKDKNRVNPKIISYHNLV